MGESRSLRIAMFGCDLNICSSNLGLSVAHFHFAPISCLFLHVWFKVGALMEDLIPRMLSSHSVMEV